MASRPLEIRPSANPGRKNDVMPDRTAAPAGGSGPPLPSLPKNATPSAEKPAAEAPLGRDESEGESFGRYTSKNEVLLRFDSEAGDLEASAIPVAVGQRRSTPLASRVSSHHRAEFEYHGTA